APPTGRCPGDRGQRHRHRHPTRGHDDCPGAVRASRYGPQPQVRGDRSRPAADQGVRGNAWRHADSRQRTRHGNDGDRYAAREARSLGGRPMTVKSAASHLEPRVVAVAATAPQEEPQVEAVQATPPKREPQVEALTTLAVPSTSDNIAFMLLSENQRIG